MLGLAGCCCVREVEKAAHDSLLARNRNKPVGPVNGNEIARSMCDGPVFSKYHDWAQYGCMKLVGEHIDTILAPLDGQRVFGERFDLLQHKQKVPQRPACACCAPPLKALPCT